MEWGKLYANLPDDPRVQAAEAAAPGAAWLLVESMCYATRAERGGFIPHTQVERFGGGARLRQRVAALRREELWLPVENGYELNPDVWSEERNLSDSAEKKRHADRARIAAKRKAAKAEQESRDTSRDSRATDHATGSGDSRSLDQSREEKRTTDDQVNHHQVADASSDDDDSTTKQVSAALAERAGRPVSGDEARHAVKVVLDRAARKNHTVGDVAAYVIEAVKREVDVYAELLFDPAPPLRVVLADADALHEFEGVKGGPCRICDRTRNNPRHVTPEVTP